MPSGKLAAQAGHAFLDAYLASTPERQFAYREPGHGTKVTLGCSSLTRIMRARDECVRLGLPHALIVDSGHVLLPHFDGTPIVTALGIGPALRPEAHPVTSKFALVT